MSRMPFRTSLPPHCYLIQEMFVLEQGRVELASSPFAQRYGAIRTLDVAHQVTERFTAAECMQGLARSGSEVYEVGQHHLWRHRHAILQILLAFSKNLQIQHQRQLRALGRLGSINQRFDEVVVAYHIQMEPKRFGGDAGDILDRTDSRGRQDTRNSEFFGGDGAQHFAIVPLYSCQVVAVGAASKFVIGATVGIVVEEFWYALWG